MTSWYDDVVPGMLPIVGDGGDDACLTCHVKKWPPLRWRQFQINCLYWKSLHFQSYIHVPKDPFDNKSLFAQVNAYSLKAAINHLSHWWSSSRTLICVARPVLFTVKAYCRSVVIVFLTAHPMHCIATILSWRLQDLLSKLVDNSFYDEWSIW